MISKLSNFLKIDIWRIRSKNLPFGKSVLIKNLRTVLLALRGFNEDKCQLRASALTFYSLLSIVPVLAMAFGVAKGFGFEKLLETQLLNRFPGQEEVLSQTVDFANRLLENTRGGMVAGIGVALLFWTVIKVLGNIEKSFNDIWGIREHRNIGRRFSDYLSIMLLCPILIIMSGSITVFISTQITLITNKIMYLGIFSPFIFFMLKLLPYVAIWVVFIFIYTFMPNTKVKFKSACLAGIIAGTIYQLAQWGYINFQVGVARYNAIYGSFAALPLFLVWLQLSWFIVLFGAEISFAHQNVDTYEFEPDCLKISYSFKKALSVQVMYLLVKKFSGCEGPATASEISHILEMPIRLVRQILRELLDSGLVSETNTGKYKEVAFQPACDTGGLTIAKVVKKMEKKGSDEIPVIDTKELSKIMDSLRKFEEIEEQAGANLRLNDI